MPELVTLHQAKHQIKVTWPQEDEHLTLLLTAAQGIVLKRVNQRISDAEAWSTMVSAWTEETVPENVRAAILLQFAAMTRFRGDDEAKVTGFDEDGLAIGVAGLLADYKDPALA